MLLTFQTPEQRSLASLSSVNPTVRSLVGLWGIVLKPLHYSHRHLVFPFLKPELMRVWSWGGFSDLI